MHRSSELHKTDEPNSGIDSNNHHESDIKSEYTEGGSRFLVDQIIPYYLEDGSYTIRSALASLRYKIKVIRRKRANVYTGNVFKF